jgi:diguanylate cyclase (GGDEF)-like protein
MLRLQNIILEMIARGRTLQDTAVEICVQAELMAPGTICSILSVDADGLLHPLAGPGLPTDYTDKLDGVPIGPQAGSCGTAAHFRREVVTTDVTIDPVWTAFRTMVEPLGIRACWSTPILDQQGDVIGTFAFYYRENRGPTALERRIVHYCVPLCVIGFDRHQRVLERERRASTDALTGLGNRASLNAALATLGCDEPGAWALLVFDLDNLKVVNDTFGHHAGDALLRTAGERIAALIAPDRVFRAGGDEFIAILQTPKTLKDLDATADAILRALTLPSDCGGHSIVPRATIGGAVVSAGDRVAETVRKNADFALYHAKETGRGGFVRYWPGLGSNMTRRFDNIREVDAALRDRRIDAYYQPVVRLDTREIVGLEALCRMRLGDKVLSANSFHEATNDVHVATALTERMMEIVARDVRDWLAMGIPFQHVGINVSSPDIHGGQLETMLTAAFAKEQVPLKHVILEVTEAVYMGKRDRVVRDAIEALRARGLRVALDDFGTGYASLTHLLTVPVDILKIDKSFVSRIAPGNASMAIVEGLVQIAGKLDIRIIAEGIETEAQAAQVHAAGCTLGQGYLFSRAVDRHATTRLLLNHAQPAQPTTRLSLAS